MTEMTVILTGRDRDVLAEFESRAREFIRNSDRSWELFSVLLTGPRPKARAVAEPVKNAAAGTVCVWSAEWGAPMKEAEKLYLRHQASGQAVVGSRFLRSSIVQKRSPARFRKARLENWTQKILRGWAGPRDLLSGCVILSRKDWDRVQGAAPDAVWPADTLKVFPSQKINLREEPLMWIA